MCRHKQKKLCLILLKPAQILVYAIYLLSVDPNLFPSFVPFMHTNCHKKVDCDPIIIALAETVFTIIYNIDIVTKYMSMTVRVMSKHIYELKIKRQPTLLYMASRFCNKKAACYSIENPVYTLFVHLGNTKEKDSSTI